MQLYIPEIGDKLTLIEDWEFTLHAEQRNDSLANQNNLYFNHIYRCITDTGVVGGLNSYKYGWMSKEDYDSDPRKLRGNPNLLHEYDEYCKRMWDKILESEVVVLPKSTTLTVDRIYIRKGNKEYSSLTFWAEIPGQKKKVRFWAKLEDCNKIKFK